MHDKFYEPATEDGGGKFFRLMLKSVRKKGCQATVSDRGDRGSFYNFEHPAFLNKIIFFFLPSNEQATTLSLR